MMNSFESLIRNIHACQVCTEYLPHAPRPILQVHPTAQILIAGQAPGLKAHQSGIPFDDASGQRLREWLNISTDDFYNPEKVAILPMGFCYPGKNKNGDLPPRPECALTWREDVLKNLGNIKLTLLIGKYAQASQPQMKKLPLTTNVKNWKDYWPSLVPMPHPSPRNNRWLHKNPWFKQTLVPKLQKKVSEILN